MAELELEEYSYFDALPLYIKDTIWKLFPPSERFQLENVCREWRELIPYSDVREIKLASFSHQLGKRFWKFALRRVGRRVERIIIGHGVILSQVCVKLLKQRTGNLKAIRLEGDIARLASLREILPGLEELEVIGDERFQTPFGTELNSLSSVLAPQNRVLTALALHHVVLDERYHVPDLVFLELKSEVDLGHIIDCSLVPQFFPDLHTLMIYSGIERGLLNVEDLGELQKLTHLTLVIDHKPPSKKALANMFAGLSNVHFVRLKVHRLSRCRDNNFRLPALPNLTQLAFEADDPSAMLQLLGSAENLQTLSCSGVNFGPQTLHELLMLKQPCLQSLTFEKCTYGPSQSGLVQFVSTVRVNSLKIDNILADILLEIIYNRICRKQMDLIVPQLRLEIEELTGSLIFDKNEESIGVANYDLSEANLALHVMSRSGKLSRFKLQ